MRRLLRILLCAMKWTGLGLSTLLLVGTVVFWVRSLGHDEGWIFREFEVDPQRTTMLSREQGTTRWRQVRAVHGRLWLESLICTDYPKLEPMKRYDSKNISADRASDEFERTFQPASWPHDYEGVRRVWHFAGLGFRDERLATEPGDVRPREKIFYLAIPFWMLTTLFALWPLLFTAVRLLRRKRHAKGLCPACGYDLRATPDPGGPRLARCPECGRINTNTKG